MIMIEYDYRYKHLQIIAGSVKMIVELSKDTMLNETTYSAKSNLLFFDKDETWGHAVGVGSDEQEALKMCFGEIKEYTGYDVDVNQITEINLPKKIVIEYKHKPIVLFAEQNGDNYSFLTPNGRKNIVADDIIRYICDHVKEFKNDDVDYHDEKLFEKYNFSKPFDAMSKNYNKDVLSNGCDLHDLLN